MQFVLWLFIGLCFLVALVLVLSEVRNKKLLETVTKLNRGTRSERKLILTFLKNGIHPEAIFHDLYINKHNGQFSQIDLVVPTKAGIVVFEVKDYSGWIFGTGYKPQWTKVLAYGKVKYRFYNPIMQNNKHIKEIRSQLKQFEGIPFYSIVVFDGNCELKDINFVPDGTFIVKPNRVLKVMDIIMKKNAPAHYTNKHEVIKVLKEAVKNGENINTQRQHMKNVKDMLGKDRIFD